jgi:hypothetical protein
MQVGVLGPLEVTDAGRPVVLAGTKLKALVAMLALHGARWSPPTASSSCCGATTCRAG